MGYVSVSQAARRPFKTKDGYLCVLPYNDGHWKRFCEVVGDPTLTNDPRFINHAARQADQRAFWGEVGSRVSERTSQEWIDALTAADVPFGRVNSLDDLLVDPHLAELGFWHIEEHPTEGMLRYAQPPISLSDSPAGVRRFAPGLGENTDEVLREMGVGEAEIKRLCDEGVTAPRLKNAALRASPDLPG